MTLAPLVCNLMHIEFNEGFEMPAVGGYLIYTLLGYWIDNYELSKKWRCVIYAAALGGHWCWQYRDERYSGKCGCSR